MLAVQEIVADMSDACLPRFGLFAMIGGVTIAGGAWGVDDPRPCKSVNNFQAQERPA